jgi:hypothetical protein
MHRQKKYYDQKLSWQSFQPGDQVFVFFPNVKPGLTTKLACLWRGPFKVIAKITDVTYKVNCGRKGKPQVIHVDRIRKKFPQNLPGEESEQIESYGTILGILTALYTLKFTRDPLINRSLLCKNPRILQGDFQLYKYNIDVMEK